MKLKGYSLMEVLVASLIFMSVIIVSVSSFAMVKNSDNHIEDVSIASGCSRQLDDVITAQIRSSNFSPRIKGLVYGDGKYIFDDIQIEKKYAGLALFTVPGKYSVIFKEGQDYFFKDEIPYTADQIINAKIANTSNANKMNSVECAASSTSANVFDIYLVLSSSGRKIYQVFLSDIFYRQSVESENSALERKTFSKISVDVAISERSI